MGKGAQQAPTSTSADPPLQEAVGAVKVFTRDDIEKREDLLIVGDEVYDAKAFRSEHPGGPMFISVFGGRDATEAFLEYHRRSWPKARMASFKVGDLAPEETPVPEDKGFLELCRLTDKVIAKTRGFAPPAYFVKLALIVGSTWALETSMLLRGATIS